MKFKFLQLQACVFKYLPTKLLQWQAAFNNASVLPFPGDHYKVRIFLFLSARKGKRPGLSLQVSADQTPTVPTIPKNLDKKTTITIGDRTFVVEADDLVKICDLGRGAYGIVEKMRHVATGTMMAVKVSNMQIIFFNKMKIIHEVY